eukprot:2456051-Rhodomonas_salina.2
MSQLGRDPQAAAVQHVLAFPSSDWRAAMSCGGNERVGVSVCCNAARSEAQGRGRWDAEHE